MNNRSSTFAQRILYVIVGIIINGLAVSLYVYSNMGVSTISSIPFIISQSFSVVSFGTATILFQIALLFILIILCGYQRKYLYSLVLGFLFGFLVDLWGVILGNTFVVHAPRIVLFFSAFLLLPLGISIMLASNLAALPFDVFTKDLCDVTHKSMKVVKTTFDVACVSVTVLISLIIWGKIEGVGIGTVISMLFTGNVIHFFSSCIKKLHCAFQLETF